MGQVMDPISNLIPGVSTEQQAREDYQNQLSGIIEQLQNQWMLPSYDKTPLTPQQYKVLSTYAPQVAAFVQQAQPELLRNIQGPGEQAQTQSLNDLQQLSSTGIDTGTKAAYELANMNADQAMRSNRANALALLDQRGLGSTGATLSADIQAGLGAAEQQRKASLQAAADASNRKAQAIQAMGNLGTQMRNQDTQGQEFNANTLNEYNELLANRRQQYNQYAAQTSNQAQMYNQQMAQNVANENTGTQNQYQMYNRQREDQMENSLVNANNQKYMTMANLQGQSAQNQEQMGMAQGQNETNTFLGLVGLGTAAYMHGAGGGAPAAATGASDASTFTSPYAGSNYTLGDTGANSFGSGESSIFDTP